LFDLVPPERRDGFRELARLHGAGWQAPVPTPAAMGITDEDEARWLAERLTPQPLATFEQPVRFGGASPDAGLAPRFFIHCVPNAPSSTFQRFADSARSTPGWT